MQCSSANVSTRARNEHEYKQERLRGTGQTFEEVGDGRGGRGVVT
jgi:hypothetical protein